MQKGYIILILVVITFFSCNEKKNVVDSQSNAEKVRNIINYSLSESEDLHEYVRDNNDDYLLMEIINNYNKNNNKNDFSKKVNTKETDINNEDLNRRVLIMSNNME